MHRASAVRKRARTCYRSTMNEPRVIQGRYRLGDKLGEGGYGAVYRAEHLAMGGMGAQKYYQP